MQQIKDTSSAIVRVSEKDFEPTFKPRLQVSQNPTIVEPEDTLAVPLPHQTRLDLTQNFDGDSQRHRDMAKRWSQAILSQRQAPESDTSQIQNLDTLKMEADKMGLSVEKYLDMRNGISEKHVWTSKDSSEESSRTRARFLDETSYHNRDVLSSNQNELAALVRDAMQQVPTNNEKLATQVMRDILRAYQQAADLQFVIRQKNDDQFKALQMWSHSKLQPMSDLAKSILARQLR